MIIDPRGLSVIEWTDFMADELSGFSTAPRLVSPEDWQGWALAVCQSPRIAAFNPPNPTVFASWLEWAERFNSAVDLPT
jgi:hypothetical protein